MTSLDTDRERFPYRSHVIDALRERDYTLRLGRLTVRCAQRFGFCWGVDRAVSMMQQAIAAGAHRQIWLLSQLIHNPAVNRDLESRGVRFLKRDGDPAGAFDQVRPGDLVVIPAFSAEVADLERLADSGCEILDTTCPWVERPHRRTEQLVARGFTLVIHGKVDHDETRATCSLILSRQGRYVVVLDLEEAEHLCGFLRGTMSAGELRRKLAAAMSPGFDPERDLVRFGVINQTTMLASESRAVAERLAAAVRERYEAAALREHFADFDTICSATQQNQDAVLDLVAGADLQVMIVVGGYGSSNTNNLARVAAARVPTYHIEDARAIAPSHIIHRELESGALVETEDWLPPGAINVGVTAGASTPDDTLGEVVLSLARAAGVDPQPIPADGVSPAALSGGGRPPA